MNVQATWVSTIIFDNRPTTSLLSNAGLTRIPSDGLNSSKKTLH